MIGPLEVKNVSVTEDSDAQIIIDKVPIRKIRNAIFHFVSVDVTIVTSIILLIWASVKI